MGKPTPSCFKIISCGGDSVDHDDLQTPESKGSSDRRRWSFRKRSARHRVLSNSVSSEAPSSANKENPESPAIDFQLQRDSTVPEKTSVIQLAEEKIELPAQLDSKLADTLSAVHDNCKENATIDEPTIIIIQAAIRRLLAQKVLLKQKNIIKLQAAVRGHIVRRHAVGTLRCVQSIIKMQALVRARRAGRLDAGSGDSAKQKESHGKVNNDSTLSGKKEDDHTYKYVSIEKLLSNAFARQLMESTPRTNPINIKCDPSKSDSAWKWLERWMSVSSVGSEETQESESTEEQHKENHVHSSDGKEDILVPSDCYAESAHLIVGVGAPVKASENHGNSISRDTGNLDIHSGRKSLSSLSSLSNLHGAHQSDSESVITEYAPIEMKETDSIEVIEVKSLPEKGETENEGYVPVLKKFSSEQIEAEAKKLSRKASSPAFIAVQSIFEELSSGAISPKLASLSSHDLRFETCLDKPSIDQPVKSTHIELADNAISAAKSAAQIGSECGTELSISSTLDSPDRSVNDISDERPKSRENLELQAKNEKSTKLESDPSFSNTNNLERYESINSALFESLNSIDAEDSPRVEKRQEAKASDVQLEMESEASPRSHMTFPESQATPSSQVSVTRKKSKGKKSGSSNRKSKSSSADKDRNEDSCLRSSLEQLPDYKPGKRRNSFGPDHKEQELGDGCSSKTLPSYMQATESARAKALANGSPRSSPDVHEKDIYIKKRHSLPGINERQGSPSPRIQRSVSQAQQNAKGNASNSPQDTGSGGGEYESRADTSNDIRLVLDEYFAFQLLFMQIFLLLLCLDFGCRR
ncbi:hypothetical protein OROGR_021431 [Orobanche gracilis]